MAEPLTHAVNRLTLDVCLKDKTPARKSLTGVMMCEATFTHTSQQMEHLHAREAQFELAASAAGELAEILAACELGQPYRVQGFLNRKSLKSVKLRLHLSHISPI